MHDKPEVVNKPKKKIQMLLTKLKSLWRKALLQTVVMILFYRPKLQ